MTRKVEVDTKTFVRFWLVILAFVLGALLIWRALSGIIIVLAAVFLAVAMKPLANRIDKIDKKKSRSSLSSVLAVLVVVLGITAVIALVGPMVVGETSRFIGQVPELLSENVNGNSLDKFGEAIGVSDLKEQLVKAAQDFSASIVGNLSNLAVDSVTALAGFLTAAILTIVLTILFMLEGPEMLENFWKMLAGKKERTAKSAEVAKRVTSKMAETISKYVSGQLTVAVLDGIVVAVAVIALSVIFGFSMGLAIPMGLIAMVLYLVPMFGPIITCVIVLLLLFINNPWAALSFAIFYIIYEQIANNVISPKIQGKGMALPPLVILVAVTIGMYAFGLIGTIVAIPIAGCIKVLVEEYPNIKALSE